MRKITLIRTTRFSASAALLVALLVACAKPAPAPAPGPETTPPAEMPPPAAAPLPSPTPEAPPPAEPSVVPKPASTKEPEVDSMLAAIPSGKTGVAVDLRYSFESAVSPDQPVTVHLAAIPHAAGAKLKVSVQKAPGLQLATSPLIVQKVSASNVYRQQVSLTRRAGNTTPLRVLVRMEMGEDSAFGYFTIPLDPPAGAGTTSQKRESVKQR